MELTIRPEDLRPGVTLVDVLALLKHGADAAAASAAQASPADLAEGSAPAGPAPSVLSPAPSGSAPSPATPSAPSPAPASSPALPQRAELIGLARTALQGGRRDAVKVLLERAGVKRMSEIPDDRLTDAIEELKELLS